MRLAACRCRGIVSLVCALTAGLVLPAAARAERIHWFEHFARAGPFRVVVGADRDVWALTGGGVVDRVTRAGKVIRRVAVDDSDTIATDTVGDLWVSGYPQGLVERVPSTGRRTQFYVRGAVMVQGQGLGGGVWGLGWAGTQEAPREALWDLTTDGHVHPFFIPRDSRPAEAVEGWDGSIWFTDQAHSRIGRLTPQKHVRMYRLPGSGHGGTCGIARGPHHTIWFTEGAGKPTGHGLTRIGVIGPTGRIREFVLHGRLSRPFCSIVEGPDHAMWFIAGVVPPYFVTRVALDRITAAGRMTTVTTFLASSRAYLNTQDLASGPDHELWIAVGGALGRLYVR